MRPTRRSVARIAVETLEDRTTPATFTVTTTADDNNGATNDRVVDANYLDEKYPERRDVLRAKWRQSLVWEQPKEP